MKRLLSILVAAMLIASLLIPVAAFAAEMRNVSIGTATGKAGEIVTVYVTLNGDAGIASLMVPFDYDRNNLELISVSPGSAGEVDTAWTDRDTGATYGFGGHWSEDNKSFKAGTLFSISFKIKDTAVPNADGYPVTVLDGWWEAADENGVAVATYSNGKVIVEAAECDHSGAYWKSLGDEQHQKYCEPCDEFVGKPENHTLGNKTYNSTTGKDEQTCSVCNGKVETTHSCVPGDAWENVADDHVNHWKFCKACGKKTDKFEAHDYDDDDWKTDVEATENSKGQESRVCSVCSHKEIKETPELGHTHNYNLHGKDNDNHWDECACGEKTNIEPHTYSNDEEDLIVDTEPDCTTAGLGHRVCTDPDCKYEKSEFIPATGHPEGKMTYTKFDKEQHNWYCPDCKQSGKETHAWNGNTCAKCGETKPTAPTNPNLDDVPKTGDITGQIVLGAAAALMTLVGSVCFVFKRKTAK